MERNLTFGSFSDESTKPFHFLHRGEQTIYKANGLDSFTQFHFLHERKQTTIHKAQMNHCIGLHMRKHINEKCGFKYGVFKKRVMGTAERGT